MIDTLLLRPSLHFTPLRPTTLHYTCRHFTSCHSNFTQPHFTTLSFGLTPFKISYRSISPHITTFHLTSFHFNFRLFSPHFCSFHFTPFIIAFPTLFLSNEPCCSYFTALQLDVTNFKRATTNKIVCSVFHKVRDKNTRAMCIFHTIIHKTITEC